MARCQNLSFLLGLAEKAAPSLEEIWPNVKEPVTTIRSFRNADLPNLLELWMQHWSAIGPPPRVTMAKFEQAVLARTFFDPSTLLLAETGDGVQAWCHFAPCRSDEQTAVICALCFAPTVDSSVIESLLAATENQIAESGSKRIQVGVVRDDVQGYTGLEPIGHGIGIPVADLRTTALLQQFGYLPKRSFVRMTASVHGYRPPVSREMLQFRRSSRIDHRTFTHQNPRHASGLSHLDVEVHRLLDRGGQQLADVKLWFSDPEAEVMSPSMVILDIASAHDRGQLEPVERYLIGTLVQSLGQRRIESVETAVDRDQTELVEQLSSLHFRITDEGVCWEKSLGEIQ